MALLHSQTRSHMIKFYIAKIDWITKPSQNIFINVTVSIWQNVKENLKLEAVLFFSSCLLFIGSRYCLCYLKKYLGDTWYILRFIFTKQTLLKWAIAGCYFPAINNSCIKVLKSVSLFIPLKYRVFCRKINIFNPGWLGWAMVLGSFQCRGVLQLLHVVGQGPAVLATGAGCVGYFIYLFFLFFIYLPFLMSCLLDGWTWLKYCGFGC